MKSFSAIVLMVFVVLALFGIFIFATFSATSGDQIGDVLIWGSVPEEAVDKLVGQVRDTREDFGGITYREFPRDELVPALVEAIAAGRGPDLIFFPSSSFVSDGDKLAAIPYESISRRDFQDAFIEAGEIFLRDDGVAAFPVIVDPLVLYWNRTLFSNASVAAPPKYWDDLAKTAERMTERLPNGSITTAAVALGDWDNIPHAKAILISLIRQLGSVVVRPNEQGGYSADLMYTISGGVTPALSAVRYYVDFADPVKPAYSWNRSQKSAREAFLAGTLAMYFAPASELLGLRAANPNLNFDVAPIPVSRGAGSNVAAEVTGLAVARGAQNPSGAATAAVVFASPEQQKLLAELLTLPSPRRDVELDSSRDAYLAVFRSSALRAFAFLDPDPRESDAIFGRMISNIASGRDSLSQAVRDAQDDLQELLRVR